jgi:hypothetical protein
LTSPDRNSHWRAGNPGRGDLNRCESGCGTGRNSELYLIRVHLTGKAYGGEHLCRRPVHGYFERRIYDCRRAGWKRLAEVDVRNSWTQPAGKQRQRLSWSRRVPARHRSRVARMQDERLTICGHDLRADHRDDCQEPSNPASAIATSIRRIFSNRRRAAES